jgi:hypothetical protein
MLATERKECTAENHTSREQPSRYSQAELDHLKKFVQLVKNNEKRAQLVCWGNHSDYTHGY